MKIPITNLLLVGLVVSSSLAQDTLTVQPGDTLKVGVDGVAWRWIVPEGGTYRLDIRGPGDFRLVLDRLGFLRVETPDTVPPPDTLPTPPPPPEPPPSTGWRVVFQDGFETGNLTTAQGGYRWRQGQGGTGEAPQIVPGGRTGNALAFTFRGNRNLSDDAWSEQRFTFGEPLQSVALDYWIFLPSNYAHRNATGPDNNKFLRLWDDNYSSYRVKLGYSTQLSADGEIVIAEWGVNQGGVDPTRTRRWQGFTDSHLNRWTHVRVEVTLGGEWLLFIDGELASANTAPNGPYLRNGYLYGWANTGFDKTTVILVDDFTVLVRE